METLSKVVLNDIFNDSYLPELRYNWRNPSRLKKTTLIRALRAAGYTDQDCLNYYF